ncbi:hypothetical protein [Shewanella halifaxensis]|uniref:hypothetical protein n=1 Tax=Shewanella halifaxensis TaxID=271098 RepID=UPI0002FD1B07|nr:hypothetical protein [Shewanella halifaxensis]
MNLLKLKDVLTLSISDIEEQIAILEFELKKGTTQDHLGRTSLIDDSKYKAVLVVLKQAKKLHLEGKPKHHH